MLLSVEDIDLKIMVTVLYLQSIRAYRRISGQCLIYWKLMTFFLFPSNTVFQQVRTYRAICWYFVSRSAHVTFNGEYVKNHNPLIFHGVSMHLKPFISTPLGWDPVIRFRNETADRNKYCKLSVSFSRHLIIHYNYYVSMIVM